jgi:hypothetical protein
VRKRRFIHVGRLLAWTLSISVFFLVQGVSARALPNQEQTQVGPRLAEAVRVDRALRLDGTLKDPLWQSAKAITDFRQREPREGDPATEMTEVRTLYTRHAAYFGIHCTIPHRLES